MPAAPTVLRKSLLECITLAFLSRRAVWPAGSVMGRLFPRTLPYIPPHTIGLHIFCKRPFQNCRLRIDNFMCGLMQERFATSSRQIKNPDAGFRYQPGVSDKGEPPRVTRPTEFSPSLGPTGRGAGVRVLRFGNGRARTRRRPSVPPWRIRGQTSLRF